MGWEEVSRGRGHMYAYGWFILMYGRNQHNIIKQLKNNKENKITLPLSHDFLKKCFFVYWTYAQWRTVRWTQIFSWYSIWDAHGCDKPDSPYRGNMVCDTFLKRDTYKTHRSSGKTSVTDGLNEFFGNDSAQRTQWLPLQINHLLYLYPRLS